MLLCFPVPPSKRQAAGPLIENLPNVLVGGPEELGVPLSSWATDAKQANVLPFEKVNDRIFLCKVSGNAFGICLRPSAQPKVAVPATTGANWRSMLRRYERAKSSSYGIGQRGNLA